MKQSKRAFKPLQNSRGMITAEFIFALVLSAGLCIVLFALNFTLSMVEVAQYVAFSSARAHAAGHVDQDKQVQMAKEKYRALLNTPALKNLFNNGTEGWFILPAEPDVRGGGLSGSSFDGYPPHIDPQYGERVPQVGVRFSFQPRILNLKLPFLGSTSEDPDAGFSANITGFLIREPTQRECLDLQVSQRYKAILNLENRYRTLGASGENKYVPMEDNGC
ncbi:MAG TPA: hypothetical protein VGE46_09575 [Bdellovibrio sp.]